VSANVIVSITIIVIIIITTTPPPPSLACTHLISIRRFTPTQVILGYVRVWQLLCGVTCDV